MNKTKIMLLRHCKTDGNSDPSLSADGHRQAKQIADWFDRFDFKAIYSSKIERAYQTATIIADKFKLGVQSREELNDVQAQALDIGLQSFIEYCQREHPDQVILAVTHLPVMKMFCILARRPIPESIGYGYFFSVKI